MVINN
ncbi:RmlC-like cupins superfamily protein [Zea mays]